MGVAERSEYGRVRGNGFAAAFSRALLDPEGEIPSLVAAPYGKGTLKRYNVYRNNVTVSLIAPYIFGSRAAEQQCPRPDMQAV